MSVTAKTITCPYCGAQVVNIPCIIADTVVRICPTCGWRQVINKKWPLDAKEFS